jgi:hypothetical protein
MAPTKILKCQHIVQGYDGTHWHAFTDVIEHSGKFWLVPEWLDNHVQKVSKPLRIISLETMVHHRMPGNPDFLVEFPIPQYVLDGRIPPEEAGKFVVIEGPEILIPRDASLH